MFLKVKLASTWMQGAYSFPNLNSLNTIRNCVSYSRVFSQSNLYLAWQCIKWITMYKIFNELIASDSQGLLTLNPVIEFFNSNYELSNYVYNGPYHVLLFSHKSTEHYWRNSLELCLIDQTTLLQSYLAYFWLQKMSLSSSGLIFQLFFGSFSYYMSK